jgi:hypothetical protein
MRFERLHMTGLWIQVLMKMRVGQLGLLHTTELVYMVRHRTVGRCTRFTGDLGIAFWDTGGAARRACVACAALPQTMFAGCEVRFTAAIKLSPTTGGWNMFVTLLDESLSWPVGAPARCRYVRSCCKLGVWSSWGQHEIFREYSSGRPVVA